MHKVGQSKEQQGISNCISESESNDMICEGFGCCAKVTTKVSVRVGSQGRVSLFLCDTCKAKFTQIKGDERSEATGEES